MESIHLSRNEANSLRRKLEEKLQERQRSLDTCRAFILDHVNPDATEDDIVNSKDYQRKIHSVQKEIDLLEQQLRNYGDEPACNKKQRRCNDVVGAPKDVNHGGSWLGKQQDEGAEVEADAPVDDDGLSDEEDMNGESVVVDKDEELHNIIEEVKKSTLFMALQGLQSKFGTGDSVDNSEPCGVFDEEKANVGTSESISYQGRLFRRGKCYDYQPNDTANVIIGITGFRSATMAECVLVATFSDTFLGVEDAGVDYKAPDGPCPYVQVQQILDPLPLEGFGRERTDIDGVPDLVYEPQAEGAWYNFAYFWKGKRERRGKRAGKPQVLDLFAGCGGMSQGLERAGFEIACAVEKDGKAYQAYRANHPNAHVVQNDVSDFLQHYESDPALKKRMDQVSHVQGSPPCQGFSGANRYGGVNDKKNNDLSLTFVDAIDKIRPDTGTYENVPGIWKRKNQHYLKRILADLLTLEYQVRCCLLRACDYGDPQARPRLFIFTAHRSVYLPPVPPPTHGEGGAALFDYVTVRDALPAAAGSEEDDASKTEEYPPDRMRLEPDAPCSTIRASGCRPLYNGRPITTAQVAALFSYRAGYQLVGTETDQLRQIGNSVPVELATAVARPFVSVLQYHYAKN